MSIRHSLLAILDQGDCYGYQLRVEFERRTGGSRTLNVGQVYATLDRLERDGFVTKRAASATGHVYYAITNAGRTEALKWFTAASKSADLDNLATKLALAQSLPHVDAASMVRTQRESAVVARDAARAELPSPDLSRRLVIDAKVEAAEAQLRWLDRVAVLLSDSQPFGLDAEPPRRGRPLRTGGNS